MQKGGASKLNVYGNGEANPDWINLGTVKEEHGSPLRLLPLVVTYLEDMDGEDFDDWLEVMKSHQVPQPAKGLFLPSLKEVFSS